jgi:hypothetical protein
LVSGRKLLSSALGVRDALPTGPRLSSEVVRMAHPPHGAALSQLLHWPSWAAVEDHSTSHIQPEVSSLPGPS